jgi:hypothetical protein
MDETGFFSCVDGLKYRQTPKQKQAFIHTYDKHMQPNSIYKHDDAIVKYYFHNQIKNLNDVLNFITYVYSKERGADSKRFKIHTDFGLIKEVFHPAGEAIDGRDEYYTYEEFKPLEQNLQRLIPIIIHDTNSVNKYKEYLKSQMIKYQQFTLGSTQEMIIAFHSMMVVVFRMPDAGKSCQDWISKHLVKQTTKYIHTPSNLCFWSALAYSQLDALERTKMKDNSLVASARILFEEFYGEEKKKGYSGLFPDELKDVSEKFSLNILVYVENENLDLTYRLSEELSIIVNEDWKNIHILYITHGKDAHYLFVSNLEKLTKLKRNIS